MKAFRKSSEISSNQGQIGTTSATYAFGQFRLDAKAEILFRGGDPVVLGRRAVALLRVLVERPEVPVSKEELMETAWPGRAVEESNLSVQIAALRRALSEEPGGEAWIKTLPRRGYRFVGPAVATIPGGVHLYESPAHPALPLPDKPSIAVLSFQNMSGDPEQEYFADGVVEEIITALSRFRQLFVIARNSSFAYKGRQVDVKQIGRELGVRYVLEGSIRRAETRVRITGQLIDVATGANLWADRFDGPIKDIFDLQDRVTTSVVASIAPKLEQAEIERANRKPTESLDAYDYYLRGMAKIYRWTNESVNDALRLFSKAIDLDTEFASAYGAAAWCYYWRMVNGWRTDHTIDVADVVRLSRGAAEYGKDDAVALSLGGIALGRVARDLETGVAMIDRALVLNPNLASAWNGSGFLRTFLGNYELAIEHLEHAMRLSPLDRMLFHMKAVTALAHFLADRNEAALPLAEQACREQPNLVSALRLAAASNAFAGRMGQAREFIARALELDPNQRISNLKDRIGPFKSQDFAKYVNGLRMAGLPE